MSIPTPVEFLLGTPLYSRSKYKGADIWDVLDILYYAGTYDNYCIECACNSTFQVTARKRPDEYTRNPSREKMLAAHGIDVDLPKLEPGIYHINATCARSRLHRQDFIGFVTNFPESDSQDERYGEIQKIGQHPSYGDLHIAHVKKYRPVLTQAQIAEFTRAIGLASHDVGVGAYVYLRRIFESLVEDAHLVAKTEVSWDESNYQRLRMNEKISALKSHLPPFLVEHHQMYGLLSKGVHELSEEECLQHFDTLRLGIELILDERLEQKERAKKVAAAKAAITKAVNGANK